mmetsp:Transcript_126931/g.395142  ORF Transcript_126931/g.395142 Transcript_126931/m.395142 type:complete len:282 (-) Transcript_126931:8-853(-)
MGLKSASAVVRSKRTNAEIAPSSIWVMPPRSACSAPCAKKAPETTPPPSTLPARSFTSSPPRNIAGLPSSDTLKWMMPATCVPGCTGTLKLPSDFRNLYQDLPLTLKFPWTRKPPRLQKARPSPSRKANEGGLSWRSARRRPVRCQSKPMKWPESGLRASTSNNRASSPGNTSKAMPSSARCESQTRAPGGRLAAPLVFCTPTSAAGPPAKPPSAAPPVGGLCATCNSELESTKHWASSVSADRNLSERSCGTTSSRSRDAAALAIGAQKARCRGVVQQRG